MRLSDEVIAHIARLLQMAILTGTDVVDHLRMVTLESTEDDDTLYLAEDYATTSEQNISKMLTEIENLSKEITS